jgi:hypothetical protein
MAAWRNSAVGWIATKQCRIAAKWGRRSPCRRRVPSEQMQYLPVHIGKADALYCLISSLA